MNLTDGFMESSTTRLLRMLFIITFLALIPSAYVQAQSNLERGIYEAYKKATAEAAAKEKRARKNANAETEKIEKAQAEARAKAEERARAAAAEAERIRKEEQFKASKAELMNSLQGLGSSSKSGSGYSSGLRGLSSDGGSNNSRSSYSSGLRGMAGEHASGENRTYLNSGLRGLSSENKNNNQSSYSSSSQGLSSETSGSNYSSKTSNPTTFQAKSSYESTRENSSAILKRTEPASKKVASRSHYTSSSGYAQYVADVEPEPIYFHSTEANFFRIGSPEPQDKSLDDFIDAFEQKVDVWKENGGHEVLAIVGEQITTFARVAVSASSVIGSQIMKLVEIVSDAKDLNNLETNIVNNSIDAYKKAAVTQNPRYVDEALQDIQQKVDQYADKKIGIRNGAKQTTSNLAEAWTRSRMR